MGLESAGGKCARAGKEGMISGRSVQSFFSYESLPLSDRWKLVLCEKSAPQLFMQHLCKGCEEICRAHEIFSLCRPWT